MGDEPFLSFVMAIFPFPLRNRFSLAWNREPIPDYRIAREKSKPEVKIKKIKYHKCESSPDYLSLRQYKDDESMLVSA